MSRAYVPAVENRSVRRPRGYAATVLQEPAAVGGLVLLTLLVLLVTVGPLLSPYDPMRTNSPTFVPPTLDGAHYFGTSHLGRDLYAAVSHGGRASIAVGLLVASLATLIGVVVGAVAGYVGGVVDSVLMRVTELFLVIPRFFLAVLVIALFGRSLINLIAILAVLSWPAIARIVRADYLSLRERDYVVAARVVGVPPWRIVFREILPNALASALVIGSFQASQALLTEAALAYLGLGDPSHPSWGQLLIDAQPFLQVASWMAVIPGIALALTVLGFNLLTDGLTLALDPQARSKVG
jgi:peptide/nickel transport system permease protein